MIVKPLPRIITRPVTILILAAWVVSLSALVNKSYGSASTNLATDLARYGSNATWRGVYYRGEKIGFTVSQTLPTDEGFELQEDGRLQMLLFGAASAATVHTTARVDRNFALQTFEFSLDPGTGPVKVAGRVEPSATSGAAVPQLTIHVASSDGTSRRETRELPEWPVLSMNLSRMLAGGQLVPGSEIRRTIFDPATLRTAPVTVRIGEREIVRNEGQRPIPAFRVDMEFQGLRTTSWVTDTGDVVREESPMGLITVRESREQAQSLAVPTNVQVDLLQAAAVVPEGLPQRIDEARDVRRIVMRLDGAHISPADLQGVGQTVDRNIFDIRDPRTLQPGPADPDTARFLAPEPLIESDAPEIRVEAEKAVQGIARPRERAERLTRYVNALLDKKPTISLPSAKEVLRTKVGDCNEHTALYVAMARAVGIPARIAIGLVYVRGVQGAFYYHAWPEVYLDEGGGRGMWLPVDPTLNEFPADGTHVRLARGGLDKQAVILPLIGQIRMTVLDLELAPNSVPILVGRPASDLSPLAIDLPRRPSLSCWSAP
jgi:transglutaminase-like putative cysteine protease